jgi:hypothetical protein
LGLGEILPILLNPDGSGVNARNHGATSKGRAVCSFAVLEERHPTMFETTDDTQAKLNDSDSATSEQLNERAIHRRAVEAVI